MRESFIRTSVTDLESFCNVIQFDHCTLPSAIFSSIHPGILLHHVDISHVTTVPILIDSCKADILSDSINSILRGSLQHFVKLGCLGILLDSISTTNTHADYKMDKVKANESNSLPSMDSKQSSTQHPSPHKDHHRQKCDRREKLGKKSTNPIVHPDVEHAQTEENRVFRFSEDCRPMFSPVPRNSSSDGESDDSPRPLTNKPAKEKLTFPAIHVEKCEKSQPPYATQPVTLPPSTFTPICTDVQHETIPPGLGGLNVPSPYLHRKSDGRLLLMTQDSNRGLTGSWSRSEGNLPDAVRCSSASSSHTNLLDIKYRPNWQMGTPLRPSSDVALHELKREGERRPATPRRLPVRLEPLSNLATGQRAVSASNLQSP